MDSRILFKRSETFRSPTSAKSDLIDEMDVLSDSLGYAIKCARVRTYEMLFQKLGPNVISPRR